MKVYEIEKKKVAGKSDAEQYRTSLCWELNRNDICIKRLPISLGFFNRKKSASEIFLPTLDFQKVCEKALDILNERKVKHIFIMKGVHRRQNGYWLSQQYHTR